MDEQIAMATVWTDDGYKSVPASEAHKYPPRPVDPPAPTTVINLHCEAYTPKEGDILFFKLASDFDPIHIDAMRANLQREIGSGIKFIIFIGDIEWGVHRPTTAEVEG